MIICEFCVEQEQKGICRLERKIPKGMSCHGFVATISGFCSDRNDFESSNQIIEMATHFGIKGSELKKVKLMLKQANREFEVQ